MKRLIALLVAVVAPGLVQAQTCYQWKFGTGAAWFSTIGEAAEAHIAACNAAVGGGCSISGGSDPANHVYTLTTVTIGTWPAGTHGYTCAKVSPSSTSCSLASGTVNATTRTNPIGCVSCMAAGTKRSSVIESGDEGDAVCGSDGCSYTISSPKRDVLLSGGFGSVATVTSNGRACGSDPGLASPDTHQAEQSDCIDGGGVIACNDPEAPGGQGCGFFNGDYVCTGHVPDDSCVEFASGGVACMAGSADAPKDSGGNPVEPDGTVSSGATEVDYYTPETVAGATTPATTVPGQGGSAVGAPGRDGSSSTGGSDSAGGDTIINCDGPDCVELDIEGECPEGETCDGALPNAGEFGEVCTFGECATAFYNRVKAAPLLAAVTGAGAAMPTGACPNWSLQAFSEDYSLSAPMCDIWDDVSGVLSAIFLVIWAWVASRIVLSA